MQLRPESSRGSRPHPWFEDIDARQHTFRLSPRSRVVGPVVLAFLLQVPAAAASLVRFDTGRLGWLAVLLALIGPVALIWARKIPGPVVAVVTAAACVDFLLPTPLHGPPYFALVFAIVSAMVRGARNWAWISIAAGWLATLLLGLLLVVDWNPGRVAYTTLGIVLVIGFGEALRSRREHFSEYRREAAQRKQTELQAERVRIARELHDVLAHSLSQINVQAGVGLHLMEKQPDKAAAALASIKDTSKTALDEVRSVLGVLRADSFDPNAPLLPEPDLARLSTLATTIGAHGIDVDLESSVDDAPKAVQLAIYRIVQESLTNVVRHSAANQVRVRVDLRDGEYVVEVADDGRGLGHGDSPPGRGLLGMRERAELLGGTLTVTPSPSGGVLVTARIPQKDAHE